jgi:uncharacterized protein YcbK (DUF882 family)
MTRAALVLVALLALPGAAFARGAPQKVAATTAPSAAAKAAYERQLRARIGKPPAKLLNLYYSRTQEWLALDLVKGATVAQKTANEFFRCHFTNQPPPAFDLRLIGVLVEAALHFGVDHIDIVSGYRAPKYNLQLRKKGHEVARDSQHTYGHAVDFRLPGVAATTLRDWARGLHLGGVGFYPESQFVHTDVGPIRTWTGR